MAKKQNIFEFAFTRFDETSKRHLDHIEKTYKGFGKLPEIKQQKKSTSVFKKNPFERTI